LQLLVQPTGASDQTRIAAADSTAEASQAPLLIGLDAALTGGAGQSGEAIRRGLLIALDEINSAGGVLGRQLQLVERDNRGIPDRGIDNIYELADIPGLVAVFGGIHTPVALAELPAIHETKTLYLGPWAAGTPVVENGHSPNYVFRVSVRDQHAGPFLIQAALDRGFKRPGLLLWRTGWGRSNEAAMTAAMRHLEIDGAGVEWFNTSERNLSDQIGRLQLAGADVVMLVANPTDGLNAVEAMAALPREHRLPIISHWGITGGDFFGLGRTAIEAVDLTFLQTYSFFEPPFPAKSQAFYTSYCVRFGPCDDEADIFSPVGSAHAYDLAYLLKAAIERAGSGDRETVRTAMENLQRHEGLVRVYDPPFTAERHDALDASDFRLCRYGPDGAIVPLSLVRAE
jgi:branched-chain amino acid transport system substrate-binding protein